MYKKLISHFRTIKPPVSDKPHQGSGGIQVQTDIKAGYVDGRNYRNRIS